MANVLYEQFIYATPQIALLAAIGSVGLANINISSDADFQVNYVTIDVQQAAVVVPNWGGTILITSSDSNKAWMNIAIPVDSIRGTGQMPYVMPIPKLIKANTTITCTATNNVATATNVALVLHGYKLQVVNQVSQ